MRVLIVLLSVVLAGCTGTGQSTDDLPVDAAPEEVQAIAGLVQDAMFTPIEGATVTVDQANVTITTGADGRFSFLDLPVRPYTVTADANGYLPLTIPFAAASSDEMLFMLDAEEDPVQIISESYQGRFQCAAEALIIGGSCDRATVEYGGVALFEQQSIFEVPLGVDWQTIIIDVVFDEGQSQGYDGLRTTVRGGEAADALTEYEQWGRFHDSTSYTIRIDPLGEYNDGDGPVPADARTMTLDMFAQGHGYHAVCDPALGRGCFLGVGGGIDVSFELIVSKFYGAPAPEGYTLQ